MFEQLLADVLNKILGDYVLNLEKNQLKVAIWSGHVTLKNLRLKKDALDKFNLPVDIKYGYLGELTLIIPWNNLKNQPVKLQIENLFIVAYPQSISNADIFDLIKQRNNEQKAKMERLETEELILKETSFDSSAKSDQKSNESFSEQLITKIIDNLQISIKNIHIRYEDDLSSPKKHFFALGVVLDELKAVSVNENWEEAFIQTSRSSIYKLANLSNLSLYLDHSSSSKYECLNDSVSMDDFINYMNKPRNHAYLLQPISASVKSIIRKKQPDDSSSGRFEVSLYFEDFVLSADKLQYSDIQACIEYYTYLFKAQYYLKYKPSELLQRDPLPVKQKAKFLWKFALESTLTEIHMKNEVWSWSYIEERKKNRINYIDLWRTRRMTSLGQKMTSEEEVQLKSLEEKLSYEDIRLYRNISDSKLRIELKNERDLLNSKTDNSESSWFKYMFGSNSSVEKEKQLKLLFETIEYEEIKDLDRVMASDQSIVLKANFFLSKGSLLLFNCENNRRSKAFEFSFIGFQMNYTNSKSSSKANLLLHNLEVTDHLCQMKLIELKDSLSLECGKPLLSIDFELFSPKSEIDYSVIAKMMPLKIIHRQASIENLIIFLQNALAETNSSAETIIMNMGSSIQGGMKGFSTAGLLFAIEEHKISRICVDIEAPVFIFPIDEFKEFAIVNLGHLNISSDIITRDQRSKLSSSEDIPSTNELIELVYDKFNLSLSEIEAYSVYGSDLSLSNPNIKNNLLEKTDLNLSICLSILPKVDTIAKTKVIGVLPFMSLKYSVANVNRINKILKSFNYNLERKSIVSPTSFVTATSSPIDKKLQMTEDLAFTKNKFLMYFDFKICVFDFYIMENDSKEISKLQILNSELKLISRTYETEVDAQIDKVEMTDYHDPDNNSFLVRTTTDKEQKQLVKIHYRGAEGTFKQQIDNLDYRLTIDMGNIEIVLHKPTVIQIITSVIGSSQPEYGLDVSDSQNANKSSSSSMKRYEINLNLSNLKVSLKDKREFLSLFFFSGSTSLIQREYFQCQINVGKLTISSVGMSVLDIIQNEDESHMKENFITFDYISNIESSQEIFLKAASVKFIYYKPLIEEFLSYIEAFKLQSSTSESNNTSSSPNSHLAQSPLLKLKLDVDLSTPIISYPKPNSTDFISAYLGSLKISNNDEKMGNFQVKIQKMCLKSCIESLVRNIVEEIDIDLTFLLMENGRSATDIEVESIRTRLTRRQICLILDLFADLHSKSNLSTIKAPKEPNQDLTIPPVDTAHNLTVNIRDANLEIAQLATLKIEGVELSTEKSKEVDKLHFGFRKVSLKDIRENEKTIYRDIIPDISKKILHLELCNLSRTLIVELSEPSIVLVPEFLFGIKNFIMQAYNESILSKAPELFEPKPLEPVKDVPKQAGLSYRIHLTKFCVYLLKDPSIKNSDLIMLRVSEVVLAQENILSLAVRELALDVSTIDRELLIGPNFDSTYENRLGVIRQFDFTIVQDLRSNIIGMKSNVISVDLPSQLNIFLSYKDISLLLSMVDKIEELSGSKHTLENAAKSAMDTAKSFYQQNQSETKKNKELIGDEYFNLRFNGVRFILIDDLNNFHLPIIDGVVDGIDMKFKDWSTNLSAFTKINLHLNYYNIENSHWEPVLEPFNIIMEMSNGKVVNLTTEKRIDLNITSSCMKMLLKVTRQMQMLRESFSSTSRVILSSPFILRNETGFILKVSSEGKESISIESDSSINWSFDDFNMIRNTKGNSSPELKKHSLIVTPATEEFDIPFDPIQKVIIDKIGSKIYFLEPERYGKKLAIRVDVELDGNVKIVTFRSTVIIWNQTSCNLEILSDFVYERNAPQKMFIKSKEQKSIVVKTCYNSKITLKPAGSEYEFSKNTVFWRDLLSSCKHLEAQKRKDKTFRSKIVSCYLTCIQSDNSEVSCFKVIPDYNFRKLHSNRDFAHASRYPNLKLVICPPLELENWLPFDVEYTLLFKTSNKSDFISGKLRENEIVDIIKIDFTDLKSLELSIRIPDSAYSAWSQNVEILQNSVKAKQIVLSHQNGTNQLNVDLDLVEIISENQTGGAKRCSIYVPYVLVNKTEFQMLLKTIRSNAGSSGDIVALNSGEIIPFSFNDQPQSKSNRIKVGCRDSNEFDWSLNVSLDAVGKTEEISIIGHRFARVFGMNNVISYNNKTKFISFTPRFIIKNKTNYESIMIKSINADRILSVENNRSIAIYEVYSLNCFSMMVKFKDSKLWSSNFLFNNVGTFHVKVPVSGTDEVLIKTEIIYEESIFYIIFYDSLGSWPYRIDNFSSTDVVVSQDGSKQRYKISKGKSMLYAWDEPSYERKILMIAIMNESGRIGEMREINFQELGPVLPLELDSQVIDLNVLAEGPTLFLLKINDYDEKISLYKPLSGVSGNPKKEFNISDDVDSKTKLTFQFCISLKEGLGLSLVDKKNQEILYLLCGPSEITFRDTSIFQSLGVKVSFIEVDNQMYSADNPIVISPANKYVSESGSKSSKSPPLLQAAVVKMKDDSYGVLYFKYFSILCQELNIQVEESFLLDLIEFFKVFYVNSTEEKQTLADMHIISSPLNDEPSEFSRGDRIYFEVVQIHPIKLNITFARSEVQHHEENSKAANVSKSRIGHGVSQLFIGPLLFAVNVLSMAIGNVTDAPIRLNSIVLENTISTLPMYVDLISKHYTQEFVGQVHKLIGSADVLGNPVGLFNLISSGVKDVFYEPYLGFVSDRPQDFGIGLARGTAKFLKKTVYGLSDTFSKFTGSVGKGLASATMDQDFMEERKRHKVLNKPKHAVTGFSSGASSFAKSLVSGVTGIVEQPIKGAEQEGVGGFFKGIGKGIVGVVTKPMVGVFDLASSVTEGIKNTTTIFDENRSQRIRLPRFIGFDGVLKPYNPQEALGALLLKKVEAGMFEEEEYIYHLELNGTGQGYLSKGIVIVSSERVLMIKRSKTHIGGHLLWTISFSSLITVNVYNREYIQVIYLENSEFSGDYPGGNRAGGEMQQVINCESETEASLLRQKIKETYDSFIAR